MRPVLAAAASATIVLVGFFGAPLVPVTVGAALACGCCWWRAYARRRAL